MTGRIESDGTVTLEGISPVELVDLIDALQIHAARRKSRALELTGKARDSRELSDRVPRGRHANRRTAGELEAEARRHDLRAEAAQDLVRILKPLRQRMEARHGE